MVSCFIVVTPTRDEARHFYIKAAAIARETLIFKPFAMLR